jgi:hypothetical protein
MSRVGPVSLIFRFLSAEDRVDLRQTQFFLPRSCFQAMNGE